MTSDPDTRSIRLGLVRVVKEIRTQTAKHKTTPNSKPTRNSQLDGEEAIVLILQRRKINTTVRPTLPRRARGRDGKMSRSRHVGLGVLVLVLYAAYSLSIGKGANHSTEKQQVTVNEAEIIEANEAEIIKGEVNVATATVSYYHCGPTYGATGNNQGNVGGKDKEIILLHGAAFTKKNWVDSGILKDFCSDHLSVYALDLNTRGLTGDSFVRTLEAFQEQGLISGNPMTIVTPSASGKALVDMGAAAVIADAVKNDKEIALTRFVRVWIPVASGSVLKASGKTIEAFRNVHVLAIHGTQDEMGRKVTKRLVELAGATPVEMYGTHPCYLDSPKDFVETIVTFLSNTVE
eukprot:scaffold68547_cov59-Attheya_sp.AAC.5